MGQIRLFENHEEVKAPPEALPIVQAPDLDYSPIPDPVQAPTSTPTQAPTQAPDLYPVPVIAPEPVSAPAPGDNRVVYERL